MPPRPHHPRRLTPPARPGSLLKRLSGDNPAYLTLAAMGDKHAPDNPAYLKLIRQCPCLHCGQGPCGEAAHVRMASGAHGKASGMGKKPADRWVLPLCSEHHRLQHKIGERQFWHDLGINPCLTAERLYAQRGDLVAMRAVVINAIMERNK